MSEELFPIAASWNVTTLSQLCSGNDASIQTGPFGTALHAADYVDEGIPCVMPQDIRDGRVSTANIAKITPEDHQRLKGYHLRVGDIVYPRRGDIVKRALITERESGWLCGTGCLRIRPNLDEVDPRFLSYYLAHPDVCAWIESNAVGATMPHLNTGLAGSIPVVSPPLPEQREIAGILGALDDKIELNRRMAATLEEMARSLYRSWFVNFDPVHAKAAGHPPAHMDPATAALFPDRFGDDGLPEGWRMGPVSDLFDILMGQSPPGDTYNDVGIGLPFFQGRTDFGFRFPTRRKFCSAPTRIAARDTVLLSVRAPVGDLNRAWEVCCIGRGVASLAEKNGYNAYGYEALWSLSEELKAYDGEGTVFGSINRKQLADLSLALPPQPLREAFQNAVGSMDDRIRNIESQNQTLATLRDSLLPRLMSGELRVGAARAQVEEVA